MRSDKLDWLDQHVVLFLHGKVLETVEQETYPLSSRLEELAEKFPDSERYLTALEQAEDYKEACKYLAYDLHRRAAVWWAYLCVIDLLQELEKAPAKPRDIADIGAPRPFNIPDWAKEPEEVRMTPRELEELRQQLMGKMDALKAQIEMIPKDVRDRVDEIIDIFKDEQRKQYGKTLWDVLDELRESHKYVDDEIIIDPESPVFTVDKELEAQIEKVRQETVDTIKSVLPEADLPKLKKQKAAALDAVYRYVVSPDDENAGVCLQIGNQMPDEPEGMLALVAFWSYGNLSPGQSQVVKTPAGMMANGLNGLLLMCALKAGGERKPKERFESYYNIGYEVARGAENWGNSVELSQAPHKRLAVFASEEPESGPPEQSPEAPKAPAVPKVSPVQRFRG